MNAQRIPDHIIAELKDRASIVDVASRYVTLKQNKSCCPLHNERTPSFSVKPSTGIFKCFGCGKAGNAVDLVMAMENLSFRDAVITMCGWYNISIDGELVPLCLQPKRESKPTPAVEYQTISLDKVAASQHILRFQENPLILFLLDIARRGMFPTADVFNACEVLHIGTTKDHKSIFWNLNADRSFAYTGQVIAYNRDTGKRIKTRSNDVQWVHTKLNIPNDAARKTFFGLHQLAMAENYGKPVGIVESAKTALIATIYFGEEMIFLATHGKYGCKLSDPENFNSLIGKTVVMFPDLKGFDEWTSRAEQLRDNGVTDVTVSSILVDNATDADRAEGDLDLADYLLRFTKFELTNAAAA